MKTKEIQELYQIKLHSMDTILHQISLMDQVENEQELSEIIHSLLQANGKEALEIFRNSKTGEYDFIIMDVMMPVMDGLEATKAIRELEREDAKKIPIIAMTANAFEEDRKACLDAGMDEHIGKPIDIPLLKRTITKLLTKNHKNRIYNETDINIE